jgi:hypothetical protein
MITIQTIDGEIFDINVDTKISITDNSTFFSDEGTYSLPLQLPYTDNNVRILRFPQLAENRKKLDVSIDVIVRSGVFSKKARMDVLSVRKNDNISVVLYLRESIFFNKINDISLHQIFADRTIAFSSIDAAIAFMHSLITGNDPRFACFHVVTDNYVLNEAGALGSDGFRTFVKEQETTEIIDDKTITVPKGFYITPFVKVRHVLQEVLAYFGYTLAPSFLDTAPFNDMVFLNDNLDTIVGNSINYVDIVPDILVTDFFNVLRKFNVEIVADEQEKAIRLVLFNDLVNSQAADNLTENQVFDLTVNYHNDYKRLKLTSEILKLPAEIYAFKTRTGIIKSTVGEIQDIPIYSIVAQFPTAYVRKIDGAIVRDGFKGDRAFTEKINALSCNYDDGGELSIDEKSFPDVVPDIYTSKAYTIGGYYGYFTYPYVGPGRTLHSKIVLSDDTSTDQAADISALKPMLCLCYKYPEYKYDVGTLYNYDCNGYKLWDYSLMFNGADGIFEKFWRKRDDLSRNALLQIDADLLLTEAQKFSISLIRKVALKNQEYFISEFKYVLGEKTVETCRLLSTKLQEPLSFAKSESDYFPVRSYKWVLRYTYNDPPDTHGSGFSVVFKTEPVAFYPSDPTPAQYASGGRYYETVYNIEYGQYDRDGNFVKIKDGTMTVWLQPAVADDFLA